MQTLDEWILSTCIVIFYRNSYDFNVRVYVSLSDCRPLWLANINFTKPTRIYNEMVQAKKVQVNLSPQFTTYNILYETIFLHDPSLCVWHLLYIQFAPLWWCRFGILCYFEGCHFVRCHDGACILSGRRSQRHLALASSQSAVGGEFLTCTELNL